MHTTTEYLDEAKARLNLPSDYALAKAIGATRQAISNYRNGKTAFDDTTALKVAELLEVDPAIVVSAAHAERARKPEEKAVWASIYERLSKGLPVVLMATCAGLMSAPSNHAQASDSTVYYVK
jgi:transcriptional regulator with XRE-family HTH domain